MQKEHRIQVEGSKEGLGSRLLASQNKYDLREEENKTGAGSQEGPTRRGGKKLSLGRLMRQAGPEKCIMIAATVALVFSSLFNLAVPAVVGSVIDTLSNASATDQGKSVAAIIVDLDLAQEGDTKRIQSILFVLLGILIVAGSFFSFVRGYLFTLAGERVVARMRKRLFHTLIAQEVGFFDVTRTGELTNRLASDTTILKDAITINISMGLRWVATVLGGIFYLMFISPELTGVMLSVVPLVAIGARCYGAKIRALSKETQDALAEATEVAEESMANVRTVRAFAKEDWQYGLYSDKIEETYRLGAKIALYYGIFIAIIGLIGSGAMVLVLWYGASVIGLSAGLLTSFVLYTLTIALALGGLSGLFGNMMKAAGANERVFQLLDRVPAINTKGGERPAQLIGHVNFEGVYFSYPARDETVLKDINLSLQPGTVTALVGPSGGGKSTVVSLLERFYDVKQGEGRITIDGMDIKKLDPQWLHNNIGIVSQEPALFATSIRDNITYGTSDATDEQVAAAAEMAHAKEFIESMDNGYHTMVGERGVRLSGGQKQRIAIARAVLMNPAILIADEATSALDAESEFAVQEALDKLMRGRTVLVVAHRLSTVKSADEVVVIQSGQVVERGTHDSLLRNQGVYAQLVKRQLEDHPSKTAAGSA